MSKFVRCYFYHCNNCYREMDSFDYFANDGLCVYCR